MTDDQILAVVQAHKEGKEIEYCSNPIGVWFPLTKSSEWGYFATRNYRVKPEQTDHLWLQDIGNGLWQEKSWGIGRHFVLDKSDASHLKYVEPNTADTSKESGEPRKPREWIIHIPRNGVHGEISVNLYPANSRGHDFGYVADKECLKVREVIE